MHRNFKKRKPNLVQKWNQTWISLLEKRDPKSRNAKKLRLISFPLWLPMISTYDESRLSSPTTVFFHIGPHRIMHFPFWKQAATDLIAYGKDPATNSNECLEKFQTAFDRPPPPHFWTIILQFFYNGYGHIYARRHRPDSISWYQLISVNINTIVKKTYPEPWKYSSFYQFHAQKALFKVPKICNINFWVENDPPPLLGLLQKLIWFDSGILPDQGSLYSSPQQLNYGDQNLEYGDTINQSPKSS